ncbi:MAG: hypothetical protein GY773_18600, partial [Actinomycetia bacterium]|nr:hypothetical protein [Actinomycetes bacterium]
MAELGTVVKEGAGLAVVGTAVLSESEGWVVAVVVVAIPWGSSEVAGGVDDPFGLVVDGGSITVAGVVVLGDAVVAVMAVVLEEDTGKVVEDGDTVVVLKEGVVVVDDDGGAVVLEEGVVVVDDVGAAMVLK